MAASRNNIAQYESQLQEVIRRLELGCVARLGACRDKLASVGRVDEHVSVSSAERRGCGGHPALGRCRGGRANGLEVQLNGENASRLCIQKKWEKSNCLAMGCAEAFRVLRLLNDEAELLTPGQRPDIIAYKLQSVGTGGEQPIHNKP
eukprot:283767-Prorocentrum_minimum.AAC.2